MVSENPNFSPGIVDCSLYTHFETLAEALIISARQNQFIQENIFNNAPVRRIAIPTNTNSSFTESHNENPF